MNRRGFIALMTLPLLVRVASALQTKRTYKLGLLTPAVPAAEMAENTGHPFWSVLFVELRKLGYVEGDNLIVERRSGEGVAERYSNLARDLVRSQPDVIFANSTAMLRHLQAATATIPIVAQVVDPVGSGFAASLAHPGANITGFTDAGLELFGKYLQILKEFNPSCSKIAYLAPLAAWEQSMGRTLLSTAAKMSLAIVGPPLNSPIGEPEFRRVFAEMARSQPDALLVATSPENFTHRQLIVNLAQENRLPALYPLVEYAALGGLVTYARDSREPAIRIAGYIDRILKGAEPANLPFIQPENYYLTINLRAATALGLSIPTSLLVRADKVIE